MKYDCVKYVFMTEEQAKTIMGWPELAGLVYKSAEIPGHLETKGSVVIRFKDIQIDLDLAMRLKLYLGFDVIG